MVSCDQSSLCWTTLVRITLHYASTFWKLLLLLLIPWSHFFPPLPPYHSSVFAPLCGTINSVFPEFLHHSLFPFHDIFPNQLCQFLYLSSSFILFHVPHYFGAHFFVHSLTCSYHLNLLFAELVSGLSVFILWPLLLIILSPHECWGTNYFCLLERIHSVGHLMVVCWCVTHTAMWSHAPQIDFVWRNLLYALRTILSTWQTNEAGVPFFMLYPGDDRMLSRFYLSMEQMLI